MGTKSANGIEFNMVFDRSTKNTHRFKDESENSPCDTLYIAKSAMPEPPKSIKVTVTVTAKAD